MGLLFFALIVIVVGEFDTTFESEEILTVVDVGSIMTVRVEFIPSTIDVGSDRSSWVTIEKEFVRPLYNGFIRLLIVKE